MLVVSLPTSNTALRMRLWRGVRAVGAASLRDGVWLMPRQSAAKEVFAALANEVAAAGGNAEVLAFASRDSDQEARLRALFDRTSEYEQLLAEIGALHDRLGEDAALPRQVARLRREQGRLATIDFFPSRRGDAVADALAALERAASPDEPSARAGAIARLEPARYQKKTWATRARPWVDRLASAWLIRRFIDPQARILWLASPADCPKSALGFDFDGARFSHVGERVTFETLLASFGLDEDAALGRIARIVHFLDVGGVPVAEAAGLEAMLTGMRAGIEDDDALLAASGQAFDFLYTHFQLGAPVK